MTKTRLPSVGQVQNPKPVNDLNFETPNMFWSLNIEIWDLFVI
jgi:hypothetical protein